METAIAWQAAIERHHGPTALILSRQNLAQPERTAEQVANIKRGGYVLKECDGTPDIILIATGSEVEITLGAGRNNPGCRDEADNWRSQGARGFTALH